MSSLTNRRSLTAAVLCVVFGLAMLAMLAMLLLLAWPAAPVSDGEVLGRDPSEVRAPESRPGPLASNPTRGPPDSDEPASFETILREGIPPLAASVQRYRRTIPDGWLASQVTCVVPVGDGRCRGQDLTMQGYVVRGVLALEVIQADAAYMGADGKPYDVGYRDFVCADGNAFRVTWDRLGPGSGDVVHCRIVGRMTRMNSGLVGRLVGPKGAIGGATVVGCGLDAETDDAGYFFVQPAPGRCRLSAATGTSPVIHSAPVDVDFADGALDVVREVEFVPAGAALGGLDDAVLVSFGDHGIEVQARSASPPSWAHDGVIVGVGGESARGPNRWRQADLVSKLPDVALQWDQ